MGGANSKPVIRYCLLAAAAVLFGGVAGSVPRADAQAAKAQAPGKAAAKARTEAVSEVTSRRDPFAPLVERRAPGDRTAEGPVCREPGARSLVVGTLALNGIVRSQEEVIAVVSSPQGRVFFLRRGDEVCNGRVQAINLTGMTFTETGRDAFGKEVTRVVQKQLYPSAGEQR